MRAGLVSALIALCAVAMAAPPERQAIAAVAAFLQPEHAEPVLNGGVLVAVSGVAVYRAAFGMADFASRRQLAADDVFQTASMSKPFTSVAILQLRDRALLSLDDPVATYLPDFPRTDITIRHLLTHTSGLPDLELYETMVEAAPDKIIGGGDIVPALKAWREPPPFRPGEKFSYANTNYQLLAAIVEAVSGQPFGDYVRDAIFRPAGMTSSFVLGTAPLGAARMPVTAHVLATMYQLTPQDVRTVSNGDKRQLRRIRYELTNLGGTLGDQNVFSTLDDLLKFDQALRSDAILSAQSQDDAYTPVKLADGSTYLDAEVYVAYGAKCSYGMGWEVCAHPSFGRIVGHAGYNRGIATMLYRNLDRDQVLAMFDNADGADFAQEFASIANLMNGDAPLEISRQRSLTRAYGDALVREGPAAALVLFNRHRGDEKSWGYSGPGLNRLGYDLLADGMTTLALEPFRLNVILHPDKAAYYDSLGEGLAADGLKRDAIAAYRRSLELDPANDSGREALRRLEGK